MANLVLKIQEPGRDARQVGIRAGLRLGRHPDNDCVLHDGKTSAWHAEVVEDDSGGLVIRDLGSSNGTKILGGPELGEGEIHPLTLGISIVMGRCNLDVAAGAQIESTKMMPAVDLGDVSASSESRTTGQEIPQLTPDSATDSQAAVSIEAAGAVAAGDQERTSSQPLAGPNPNDETRLSAPAMADPMAAPTAADVPAQKAEPTKPPTEVKGSDSNKTRAMPIAEIQAAAVELGAAAAESEAPDKDAVAEKRAAGRAAAIKKAAAKKKAAAEASAGEAPEAEAKAAPAKKEPAAKKDAPAASEGDDEAAAKKKEAVKKAALKKAAAKKAAAKKKEAEPAEEKEPEKPYMATVAISRAQLLGRPEDLAAIRPRLILDNNGDREVLDILSGDFEIGRKVSERSDSYGVIDSPSVSTRHARVRFMEGRFFIEDCGSKNGTIMAGKSLPLMSFKELQPDTTLAFGNVKALYVADLNAEGVAVNPSRYSSAAEALERRGFLSKSEREQAAKRALEENRHIGEILILEGRIGVEQWSQAVHGGQVARDVKSASSAANSRLLLIGGAIIALLGVLAWYLLR